MRLARGGDARIYLAHCSSGPSWAQCCEARGLKLYGAALSSYRRLQRRGLDCACVCCVRAPRCRVVACGSRCGVSVSRAVFAARARAVCAALVFVCVCVCVSQACISVKLLLLSAERHRHTAACRHKRPQSVAASWFGGQPETPRLQYEEPSAQCSPRARARLPASLGGSLVCCGHCLSRVFLHPSLRLIVPVCARCLSMLASSHRSAIVVGRPCASLGRWSFCWANSVW